MQENNLNNIETTESTTSEITDSMLQNQKEPENTNKKKKKKKTKKVIINIITIILFIIIVLEAGIGIINMQRISNNEDPIWYLSTKKTETELKTVTEYHLGLYKIVKTDTAKETKITLKPFFLKD